MTLTMTDIEAALAEALHDYAADCGYRWVFVAPDSPDNHYERTCEAADHQAEAAAILAHPAMQAIARQAAVGAAVLEAIEHGARLTVYRSLGERYYEVVWTSHGIEHRGSADTLPEAIAAALGGGPMTNITHVCGPRREDEAMTDLRDVLAEAMRHTNGQLSGTYHDLAGRTLSTPEGKALSALVEAALAYWFDCACHEQECEHYDRLGDAADAYREATR